MIKMIQMKEGLFKAYLHRLYRMLYRRRAGTVYEKKKASERIRHEDIPVI